MQANAYTLPVLLGAAFACLAAGAQAEPGHAFPALTGQEIAAITAAVPEHARAKPKSLRRVLVFHRTEGYVHASIPYANEALRTLGRRTGAFEVELGEDMSVFTAERLARFDAIVLNSTTRLAFADPAHREALLAFVRGGKGLAAIHAAADSFYSWPQGQALIGGLFHSHPWVAEDTVAVKLDDPHSPIVAAFDRKGFSIRDEIYQIVGPYDRSVQRELLSLDMSKPGNARPADQLVRTDGDFPIAWIKREGKGRVFYTCLGHNAELYSMPSVLQHYLDGIQYAIGDLRADDAPSAPPQG